MTVSGIRELIGDRGFELGWRWMSMDCSGSGVRPAHARFSVVFPVRFVAFLAAYR